MKLEFEIFYTLRSYVLYKYIVCAHAQIFGQSRHETGTSVNKEGSMLLYSSIIFSCLRKNVFVTQAQGRRNEIEEVASLYAADAPRPDISVNCDEVRAAMSGFTLPPSSIPPWAENIPEAQWATTLMQQLQRLLAKDDSSKPAT